MIISTISELQASLSESLRVLRSLHSQGKLPPELRPLLQLAPPPELVADVSLRHRDNDRQIKCTASVSSWVPGACGVWIEYVPEDDDLADHVKQPAVRSSDNPVDRLVDELIRHLDDVQHDPRWRFTSWTWFRDQYLASRGWSIPREETQRLLEELVQMGVATTDKVANPKNPQFPVTSLNLERSHPRVQRELGIRAGLPEFKPVPLKGRPVSEMIIEDRR